MDEEVISIQSVISRKSYKETDGQIKVELKMFLEFYVGILEFYVGIMLTKYFVSCRGR
jgi:hypothetical protein